MLSVTFKKETVEKFLDALRDSPGSISMPTEGWSDDNLLMLAGACAFMREIRGTRWEQPYLMGKDYVEGKDRAGKAEWIKQIVHHRIAANEVIEWVCERCLEIIDADYDDKFDQTVRLSVGTDEEDSGDIVPLEGFKDSEP